MPVEETLARADDILKKVDVALEHVAQILLGAEAKLTVNEADGTPPPPQPAAEGMTKPE